MKLGISYVVFEGEELLKHALPPIRHLFDHISIVWQNLSYHGNVRDDQLFANLNELKREGLIDQLVFFDQNTSVSRLDNETNARNIGRLASKNAGCSHHISADVDEFYIPEQLLAIKKTRTEFDSSICYLENYFKKSYWQIYPFQKHKVTLIHPVDNCYSPNPKMQKIDFTRRMKYSDKCLILDKNDFCIHHMSYVRRSISLKIDNSSNWTDRDKDTFLSIYDTYKVGEQFSIPPGKTILRTKLSSNFQFEL